MKNIKKVTTVVTLVSAFALTGCSNLTTSQENTLGGAALGAAVGAGIGAASGGHAGTGAAIGAAAGAIGGSMMSDH